MAKSKEEIKADNAARYRANREARIAYAKAYHEAHKEDPEYKARRKAWQQNNLDRHQVYNREYTKRNPGASTLRVQRRKVAIKGNGYEPYTLEQVLEEYGAVCYLCEEQIDLTLPRKIGTPGWGWGLHIDHVEPISKGGKDCLENVAPTHAICNLNKRGN